MKSKKLRRGMTALLSLSLTATLPGVQALSVVAQEAPPVPFTPFDESSSDEGTNANSGQFEEMDPEEGFFTALNRLNLREAVRFDTVLLNDAIDYAEEQKATENYGKLNLMVKKQFDDALAAAKLVAANPGETEEVMAAWEALLNACHLLDFTADKTGLDALIKECDAIDPADHADDPAWPAFEAALTEAKEVLASETALDASIEAAVAKLTEAKGNLENGEVVVVNKTLLEKAVKYAKEADKTDVHPVVIEALNKAVEEAEAVLGKENATQDEINAAWEKLVKAIQYLDFKANKDALNALIDECKAVDESKYEKDANWDAFQKAITDAEAVRDNELALQGSIDAAIVALNAAKAALTPAGGEVTEVNKSLLNVAIEEAKAAKNAEDYATVNEVVKAKFEEALAEAEAVKADADATQAEVDAAWTQLVKMIQMLDFQSDKSALDKAIKDAEAIKAEDYKQDDAWTAFEEALATAKEVQASDTALQERIDAATTALNAAIDALNPNDVETEVNKVVLKQTIDYAKEQDTTGVNELVKEKFDAALAAAEAVYNKADATQDEVNKAYKDLVDAIHMLDFKADKTALDEAIKDAEAINGDDYKHDAAWDAFQTALAAAKDVQADKKALQARIDEVTVALRAAMADLNENNPDVEVNKELLDKAIAYADAKVEEGALEGVNEVVVEKFNVALAAAKAVSTDDNATQEEVNDAWRELVHMIQMLDFKADKSALEELINKVKDTENDNYTEDSWKAFEDALKAANDVLADKTALQDDIDTAYNALDSAFKGLKKDGETETVNKTLLNEAIDRAKAEQAKDDYDLVNAIVKAKFEEALAEAEAVKADADATQAEVDAAWQNLVKMIQMLDFKSDKSGLEATIAKADAIDASQYEKDAAWDAFQEALTAANTVKDDPYALQGRIDEARLALEKAMAALNRIDKLDLSQLNTAIAKADNLDLDSFRNTELKSAFVETLAKAKAVAAAPETQEQINETAVELSHAMIQIRLLSAKDRLENLK